MSSAIQILLDMSKCRLPSKYCLPCINVVLPPNVVCPPNFNFPVQTLPELKESLQCLPKFLRNIKAFDRYILVSVLAVFIVAELTHAFINLHIS